MIERNLLFGASNGEGVKLGGPSSGVGGSARVTVRDNTIWNTAQSVLVNWQSVDNVISSNVMGATGSTYGAVWATS